MKFGRTVETARLTNVGWNNYDSLQSSLQRRLSKGVSMNVAYTYSKAFGICCDTLSDNPPMIQAMDYLDLTEARLSFDRPHNFQASVVAELPFGPDKPFLNKADGIVSALVRGWQVNGLFSAYSGAPFSIGGGRRVAQHDGEHADGRSGQGRGDPRQHRAWPVVLRSARVQVGHRSAIR